MNYTKYNLFKGLKSEKSGAMYNILGQDRCSLTYYQIEDSISWSYHVHDFEQITLILEGKMIAIIEEEEVRLEAGDAIAIPPLVPHCMRTLSLTKAVDAWSVCPAILKSPKSNECSDRYFDQIASDWEEMRKGLYPDTLREKIYQESGVKSQHIVADIGMGSGFLIEGLLSIAETVYGIEPSLKMREEVLKKNPKKEHFVVLEGTMMNIPLESSSLDIIFGNMVLHHLEDPIKGIEECFRVLKQGGKLVISDSYRHNNDFLRSQQYDLWLGFKKEWIERWLIKAGFKNINIQDSGMKCTPTCRESSVKKSTDVFISIAEKGV